MLQVGSTRRIENLKEARGATEIDVSGMLVMPGFVDPELHVGAFPDSPSRKSASISKFYTDSLSLMRSCLEHGTLNAQVKASLASERRDFGLAFLRQLARIGDRPIGMLRTWHLPASIRADRIPELADALSSAAKRKLVQRIELVVAEDGESPAEGVLAAARESQLGINLRWQRGSPARLANLLESLRPFSLTCPAELDPGVSEVIARWPRPVVFSPSQSITGEQDWSAIRHLADDGACLTLASGYRSDGLAVLNMQAAIALAVFRLKMKPEEAIVAATANAACALGRGNVIGSLEPGKRADLLVMNLTDYRDIPRRFGVNLVGMVIQGGKVAYNRLGSRVSAT